MKEKNIIGFWGYPHPSLTEKYKNMYPKARWLDLDIDYGHALFENLPDSYCRIIKNIYSNAMFYKDEIIAVLAPIGKDKCDSGWFAAQILSDIGLNVVESVFETKDFYTAPQICTSSLPLKQKVELITSNIIKNDKLNFEKCIPKFGFWGVPPNDLSILTLFPNETHLYGWCRCVEAKTPADIELEMFVDEGVPTVFYAQAFCAKTQLAKYLANKYQGLFIDIDDIATNSTKAKIEAFIKLR